MDDQPYHSPSVDLPGVEDYPKEICVASSGGPHQTHFFKCSKKCWFSTDDDSFFLSHLLSHSAHSFHCTYCGATITGAANLVNHTVVYHGTRKFQCSQCFYCCCSRTHQVVHTLTVHQSNWYLSKVTERHLWTPVRKEDIDGKVYECLCSNECHFRCLTSKMFCQHLSEKHSDCMCYTCHICLQQVESPMSLVEHYGDIHKFYAAHCLHCNFGSNNVVNTLKHVMQNHSDQPFRVLLRTGEAQSLLKKIEKQARILMKGNLNKEGVLDKNPIEFSKPLADPHLVKNMILEPAFLGQDSVHPFRIESVSCALDKCAKSFHSVIDFINHVMEEHPGKMEFSCPHCNLIEKACLRDLFTHLMELHSNFWECPFKSCLFVGKCQKDVDDHMRVHRGFRLDHCDFEFPKELKQLKQKDNNDTFYSHIPAPQVEGMHVVSTFKIKEEQVDCIESPAIPRLAVNDELSASRVCKVMQDPIASVGQCTESKVMKNVAVCPKPASFASQPIESEMKIVPAPSGECLATGEEIITLDRQTTGSEESEYGTFYAELEVGANEAFPEASEQVSLKSVELYSCDLCGQCEMESLDYFKHMSLHHGIKLFCGCCQKGYKVARMLVRHLTRHHPQQLFCVKRYQQNKILEVIPQVTPFWMKELQDIFQKKIGLEALPSRENVDMQSKPQKTLKICKSCPSVNAQFPMKTRQSSSSRTQNGDQDNLPCAAAKLAVNDRENGVTGTPPQQGTRPVAMGRVSETETQFGNGWPYYNKTVKCYDNSNIYVCDGALRVQYSQYAGDFNLQPKVLVRKLQFLISSKGLTLL